jgi:hypothetical protein
MDDGSLPFSRSYGMSLDLLPGFCQCTFQNRLLLFRSLDVRNWDMDSVIVQWLLIML